MASAPGSTTCRRARKPNDSRGRLRAAPRLLGLRAPAPRRAVQVPLLGGFLNEADQPVIPLNQQDNYLTSREQPARDAFPVPQGAASAAPSLANTRQRPARSRPRGAARRRGSSSAPAGRRRRSRSRSPRPARGTSGTRPGAPSGRSSHASPTAVGIG